MKNQQFFSRFGFALRGMLRAWQRERSFRAQSMFGLVVIAIGLFLPLSPVWWAVLALSIGLVLVLEMVNTAIELLCDVVHPGYAESIRDIKDIMAGGVLLAAVAAVITGLSMIYYYRAEFSSLF